MVSDLSIANPEQQSANAKLSQYPAIRVDAGANDSVSQHGRA